MKNIFIAVVLLLLLLPVKAQEIGAFLGVNTMTNHPFSKSNNHFYTSIYPRLGYSTSIEVDDIKLWVLPIKITARFSEYSSVVINENSGLGGGYRANINQDNQSFSLGLHFLKSKAENKFQWSLGVEYSLLLNENYSGTTTNWSMGYGSEYGNIKDYLSELNTQNKFSIIGAMGYKIPIGAAWYIKPQLTLLAGLSDEFTLYDVKAIKYIFEIGVCRKIEKSND